MPIYILAAQSLYPWVQSSLHWMAHTEYKLNKYVEKVYSPVRYGKNHVHGQQSLQCMDTIAAGNIVFFA